MNPSGWRTWWRREGGGREVIKLALPLVLSNSFWTLQVTIDRVLLSRYDSEGVAVGAALAAVLFFWTPLILPQQTASYATTFVAQYVGAGRRERVGPAVWQSLWFSVLAGLAFLLLVPFAGSIIDLGAHEARLRELEITYFVCLCFSALPALITAAASCFFAGRGDSWTVLLINGVGFAVNAVLDYLWIFGYGGFPEMGIAGAGWATVAGTSCSAVVALALMLRRQYRIEFATLSGWRLEPELFGRMLYYGVPSGLQWLLDALAFTVFVIILGRLGAVELSATSIVMTINMVAFMPTLGVGQAVTILVGQRLGQDRPDLAARSTWTGFIISWLYMTGIAVLYVAAPDAFLFFFASSDPVRWNAVAGLVRWLLWFVAFYSLFDSMNLIFSFALKGAGDTRFVTGVSLALSWPIMVVPTWLAWYYGWHLGWAWAAASAYVTISAVIFLLRFLGGKWRSMRVIEQSPEKKLVPGSDAVPESEVAPACEV